MIYMLENPFFVTVPCTSIFRDPTKKLHKISLDHLVCDILAMEKLQFLTRVSKYIQINLVQALITSQSCVIAQQQKILQFFTRGSLSLSLSLYIYIYIILVLVITMPQQDTKLMMHLMPSLLSCNSDSIFSLHSVILISKEVIIESAIRVIHCHYSVPLKNTKKYMILFTLMDC